jgi:hypothetical protein
MPEIIDAGDSGIVQRRNEHSNRPTEYFVNVPSDNEVYYIAASNLEKIDDPPGVERG